MHVITIAAALATLVASVLGAASWLVRGLRKEVTQIQHQVRSVGETVAKMDRNMRLVATTLYTILPAVQWKDAPAGGAPLSILTAKLVDLLTDAINSEEQWRNPLSEEELGRLKRYRDALRSGQMLTPQEAEDMKRLAERVEADHPNDSTAAALLLAAAALWLLLSSRKT
jgi:hypothetical protein